MEAFLVSAGSVAIAEMGDRTQLLSLVLAARFRRPWPIIAAILVATVANHAAAGAIGTMCGRFLTSRMLNAAVGVSMVAMALWTLKPDRLDDDQGPTRAGSAFMVTLVAFFVAEIGDKTQIATIALAAAYSNLVAVVAGTTCGMMLANIPVVFLGRAFADRLPLRALNLGASLLFLGIAAMFLMRAAVAWYP